LPESFERPADASRLGSRRGVKRQLVDRIPKALDFGSFFRGIGALFHAREKFVRGNRGNRTVARRKRRQSLHNKRVIPHRDDARVGVEQVLHCGLFSRSLATEAFDPDPAEQMPDPQS
jgi:hypothetical protein